MIEFRGLRENVKWIYPRDEMIIVLRRLAEFSAHEESTIFIHSMNDHRHQRRFTHASDPSKNKRESLHYSDLAVDFSIEKADGTLSMAAMDRAVRYLRKTLPPLGYDILWRVAGHTRHAHVEYDVFSRDFSRSRPHDQAQ